MRKEGIGTLSVWQKAGDSDCGGNDINRGYCNESRSMAE